MRRYVIVLMLFAGFFGGGVAAGAEPPVKVVVTLFPLYDFCRQVGGEEVEVRMLMAPGLEPHGFHPSPSSLQKINQSDLFIYTSPAMEPWLADIRGNLSSKVSVLAAGDGLATGGHAACESGCVHGDHAHENGPVDPHVWLDFGKAQLMVDAIARRLAETKPGAAARFTERAERYKAVLAELDERTRNALSGCKLRTVISGGHFAFGYYVKRYGLEHQSPYNGFSPDAEPSPAAIAQLIDVMKTQRQSTIFTEEMVSDRVAKIISNETGATLSLLHAAHNLTPDEFERGVTFVSIMEGNLERLVAALKEPGGVEGDAVVEKKPARTGMVIFGCIVAIAIIALGSIVWWIPKS